MKKARNFLVLVAVVLIAGATPFVAFAQSAPAAVAPAAARVDSARAKAALTQSVATAKTVEKLTTEIAELRKSGGDSKRLARLESAYREMKASGGDKIALAKAEAFAIESLKNNPEGLKAFAGRNDGPARDLSRSFKDVMAACPAGTRPVFDAHDMNVPGIGFNRGASVHCEELRAPRLPEKESEIVSAKGVASANEITAIGAAHAVEANAGWEPPAQSNWMAQVAAATGKRKTAEMSTGSKILVGSGATLAASVASYFAAGALFDANRADRNGKIAIGVVLPIGVAITLWQALSK